MAREIVDDARRSVSIQQALYKTAEGLSRGLGVPHVRIELSPVTVAGHGTDRLIEETTDG
jgi:hypothetical protein